MIINMTTYAGRKPHYIEPTLESLFESDGRDLPLNLIMGSSDTSYVERYRKVANIVPWDQEAQDQWIEGNLYHNFNINAYRALSYGDDDQCLCCEDDIIFDKHWLSELMLTIAQIGHKDFVLNLGQERTPEGTHFQQPGVQLRKRRYSIHTQSYLNGSQAIFYPSKSIRNAIVEYAEHSHGIADALIGRYAKKYAALYNTTPALIAHIGDVSSFQWPAKKEKDDPLKSNDVAEKKDRAPKKEEVDSIGVSRELLWAGAEPKNPWTGQSKQVLHRRGLDWNLWASYLTACGLARPLLGRLKSFEPPWWIPSHFVDRIHTRASRDSVDDLIKREALSRVAKVLQKIGGVASC